MVVSVYLLGLLVTGSILILTEAHDTCPYLITIANGYVKYEDPVKRNYIKGKVSFGCRKGFSLENGPPHTTCEPTGRWADHIPVCVDRRCKFIDGLQDGKISYYCNYPGCEPKFECDRYYNLDGEASIKCQSDGYWSHPIPICRPSYCKPIKFFANGVLTGYKNPPLVGTSCTIKCDPGFKIVGKSAFYCQDDLTWTEMGTCECIDSHSTYCKANNCPHIISIPFGFHEVDSIKHGSWLRVKECFPNYAVPFGVEKASKCHDGAWSPTPPDCKDTRCPHIEFMENGKVTGADKYALHDKIGFTCNEMYDRKGPDSLVCKEAGAWGPGDVFCQRLACKDMLAFNNGYVLNYNNKILSDIEFRCDDGFVMIGEPFLRCAWKETGIYWNRKKPKCVQPVCKDKVDVVFVVDLSGLISDQDLNKIREFIKCVIEYLVIGPYDTRVALIKFGLNAKVEFGLSSFSKKSDLKAAVMKLTKDDIDNRATNTNNAIHTAQKMLTSKGRDGAFHVMVVLTDGFTNAGGLPLIESEKAREAGTITIAVAVGDKILEIDIEDIAGDPSRQFNIDGDIQGLSNIPQDVAEKFCEKL